MTEETKIEKKPRLTHYEINKNSYHNCWTIYIEVEYENELYCIEYPMVFKTKVVSWTGQ